MLEEKWRFPASGFGQRMGISDGNAEAFKKTPVKSFAREILQNSIDARNSDEEPTRVEFSLFEMQTSDIPGYEELKSQIIRCKEFWCNKEDYVEEYEKILEILDGNKISCLRVSDFNTTGLTGVESNETKGNKFLALTKGAGVSEKTNALAGGSKGVGKNAAFLMSSINTVFYSTKTNKDVAGNDGVFEGALGVSELVSGYLDDNTDLEPKDRDYTQGTGFFSSDKVNSALKRLLKIDNSFERGDRFGTDVFILGFRGEDDWENEIINSLLDSFMSTIVRGELEVNVNGLEINKDKIEDIIYNNAIINKNNRSNVISQYRLLKNENDEVHIYTIDTEYGSCDLFVLPFSKKEEELATHSCVMIRHPLMKIKDIPLGPAYRVSAMCIIGEGKLGKKLRSIENPQHIDWEIKRITDKTVKKEIESVLRSIKEQIQRCVIDCLQLGNDEPLDPNGAGDFLPDSDFGDSGDGEINGNQKPIEKVSVSKPKMNETIEKNATINNNDGNALQPDIGDIDDNVEGNISHPTGRNDSFGGDVHPGSEMSGEKSGEDVIFKKYKLSGVRYKVISTDRENGKMRIIFVAPINYERCYLSLNLLDDSNAPTQVQIFDMNHNGTHVDSDDFLEYGPFKITLNTKVVLDVTTDMKGYFASEVKVICK